MRPGSRPCRRAPAVEGEPAAAGRSDAGTPTILTRRGVLRLGALAAGGALAGCAGAGAVSRPPSRWRIDRGAGGPGWAAVDVAEDRVTRTLVGLRPYRPGGFVVRAEMLDGKPVIHNYGHGGGGITLSWGTAHLAVEEALRTEHREAAVLGCGAVGLATARLLQRSGWKVRIYARDLPPNTTSNVAAGQWSPTSVFDRGAVDATFMSRFARASRLAFRHYQSLVGPRYGVRWIDNFHVSDQPIRPDQIHMEMPDVFPGMRTLEPDEHPFPVPHVRRVITMLVETSTYLREMMADVRRAGGNIIVREIHDRHEIASLPEPLVVNCTGLGAATLFGDPDLLPLRGQLEILLPQPEIDYILIHQNALLYLMPRADGIALGGSFEEGETSLAPDPEIRRRIVSGHARFFQAMRDRLRSGSGS